VDIYAACRHLGEIIIIAFCLAVLLQHFCIEEGTTGNIAPAGVLGAELCLDELLEATLFSTNDHLIGEEFIRPAHFFLGVKCLDFELRVRLAWQSFVAGILLMTSGISVKLNSTQVVSSAELARLRSKSLWITSLLKRPTQTKMSVSNQ